MGAPATLRRAETVVAAVSDLVRRPAPPRTPAVDLAPAVGTLRRAGAEVAQVHIDARAEPWTSTGLEAREGSPITWLAHGDTWTLSRRGGHFDARWQLRVRTGKAGPALDGTGPTFTAVAPRDGRIEVCSLFPGEFRGNAERNVYDRIMPRSLLRGGFDVSVAAWPRGTDVAARLADAADQDPTGLCSSELRRYTTPLTPPAGWVPHRHIPFAGLHHGQDGEIHVQCRGEVEIICHPVRAVLTDGVELLWRWRLDELPSGRPEDTLLTHDYMSVAVEFSDGRDLSYYWSAELPTETSYRCPFPHWRHREWHLVVHNGGRELGTWQKEERKVAQDRAKAIGGPAPVEIVAVWLIASCVAAGRLGIASYSDIELVDGESTISIL